MSRIGSPPVRLIPNQGWDPRILVCGYELAYEDYVLPMQVFIVVSERYVVIVDTLVNEETASGLLDIARPYLDARTLLVVNTHADYDHAWGNQLFGADGPVPAPIIGTRACALRMRSEEELGQLARLQLQQPDTYGRIHLYPPDILFEDALTIDGGDVSLRLLATPGHSAGHCSIYIAEIHTLLAGDAAEMPFPSATGAGLPDLRDSLARLEALQARVAFYCHAPLWAGPELIRRNIEYFDKLEAQCRAALERGVPVHAGPDADVEALVAFRYAEAVAGAEAWAEERYCQPGHCVAIRQMLAWLGKRTSGLTEAQVRSQQR